MIESSAPRLHLRDWRKFRGLTQVELAAKAGMPQPMISNLEGQDRTPIAQNMTKLAAALECEPHELYFAPEEEEQ